MLMSAMWTYTVLAVFRMPFQENYILWKIIGFAGILTFGSRFVVQWLYSEKLGESRIPPAFWWQSLIATLLCLAYFVRQQDSVGILGYSVNIVPYVRNIMLIQKQKKRAQGLPDGAAPSSAG